jgi:hypothetical protein
MNTAMEEYKILFDTIKSAFDNGEMTFSDTDLCINLLFATENEAEQIQSQFPDLGIERIHTQIIINCRTNTLDIYKDIDDYRLRIKLDESDTFAKDIIILNFSDDSYCYNKNEDCCYKNFRKDENCFLFSNTQSFFRLISFLKKQEHKEDHQFYFVDYFNKDNRRIIITSSAKQGKLTIGYEQGVPNFPLNTFIKNNVERFIDSFNQKQLPKFIKTELFNVLPSCMEQEKRLEYLVNHLAIILERAEQNFEIYLNDLSLDNFKKQYLDFRIKYFNLFRDILAKITTQVLAFPLSITAAAFATYKVTGNAMLAYSIVGAFIIFSIYSIFMLGAYIQDINENSNLFTREYDDLSKNSFFTKYPSELCHFESTNQFVNKRHIFLRNSIWIYAIVSALTNSLFIFFVLNQYLCVYLSIIISGIIFLCLLLLIILQLRK